MKKIITIIALLLTAAAFNDIAAQVSVNATGEAPDNSAMLDVSSTANGILIPRMTTAQRDAISTPANGLLIFCTDNNQFYYNMGTPTAKNWVMANSQWYCNGPDIYYSGGKVGIGTESPTHSLHVQGNLRLGGALYDMNNDPGTNGQILSSTATGVDWITNPAVTGSGAATQVAFWVVQEHYPAAIISLGIITPGRLL